MPIADLKAAAFYAALHVLLLMVLAILVVRQRRTLKVGIGDGGQHTLARAIRVHGNALEQAVPTFALLAFLALLSAPLIVLHLFGAVTLAARVLHAAGLSSSAGVSFGRSSGMMLSWTALACGAIYLIVLSLS